MMKYEFLELYNIIKYKFINLNLLNHFQIFFVKYFEINFISEKFIYKFLRDFTLKMYHLHRRVFKIKIHFNKCTHKHNHILSHTYTHT